MRKRFKKQFTAATVAVLVGTALTPSASAVDLGTKSLASVLTAKSSYDFDSQNFDILTAAVLAVLKAKPASPVKVLTEGTVPLTAFIPTDAAFQKLVSLLNNKPVVNEALTFAAVAGLGIDTVEQVLLYHVVPGAPILSGDALKANGASLATALTGKTIAVSVTGTTITLGDLDPVANNPVVNLPQVDINKGNQQVAHGINAVLLPVALLKPLGTKSLATVLTAKSSFDKFSQNYDILTAAILAVLKAKPNSPVKALTDGTIALTAFIPTDGAFRNFVRNVSKKTPNTEQAVFDAVAALGIDKVEEILKYHVVVGSTIVSEDVLKSNGVTLLTALSGKAIKIGVRGNKIELSDYSKLRNPKVIVPRVDINRGNLQIAHAIDTVLMPNK